VINKIGFFAGSFDPIHDGHVEVVRSAVSQVGLDRLYILVEPQPWTNKKPIAVEHRRAMVDLAFEQERNITQLTLNDKRFDLRVTLPQLEKLHANAQLYFIFGADAFVRMDHDQWQDLDRLLRHYIVVFERAINSEKEISQHAKRLGIDVVILPSKHHNHSSSDVRMHPHKKDIWVPRAVANYIHAKKLY
jgi:nicotinate-nucleotide adenylyltransferase